MDIQNGATTLKEESGQSSLKPNVPETLSGVQGLPEISPLTYETMEASETMEDIMIQDMIDNPGIWKNLTEGEALKRAAMIFNRGQDQLEA